MYQTPHEHMRVQLRLIVNDVVTTFCRPGTNMFHYDILRYGHRHKKQVKNDPIEYSQIIAGDTHKFMSDFTVNEAMDV
jgi:hypothetical protein